jgi:hypothetical protein
MRTLAAARWLKAHSLPSAPRPQASGAGQQFNLAQAAASVEAGIYSEREARQEFLALAGIKPDLARQVLVGMLEEVLPLGVNGA